MSKLSETRYDEIPQVVAKIREETAALRWIADEGARPRPVSVLRAPDNNLRASFLVASVATPDHGTELSQLLTDLQGRNGGPKEFDGPPTGGPPTSTPEHGSSLTPFSPSVSRLSRARFTRPGTRKPSEKSGRTHGGHQKRLRQDWPCRRAKRTLKRAIYNATRRKDITRVCVLLDSLPVHTRLIRGIQHRNCGGCSSPPTPVPCINSSRRTNFQTTGRNLS